MIAYPHLSAILAHFDFQLLGEVDDYFSGFTTGLNTKQRNALRKEITHFLAVGYTPEEIVRFWNRHGRARLKNRNAAFVIEFFQEILKLLDQEHQAMRQSYTEKWLLDYPVEEE